jgi:glutathione synthase/RimK-type ligase-like ATP-grasp enzyme
VNEKNNLHVKLFLQWFWLKSGLHKPWNGIVQVAFGLDHESSIVTKPHQGFFGKGFCIVKNIGQLVKEVFIWI